MSSGPTFDFDFGSVTLSVDEIWPDGDAPENPTAQDVADVIKKGGGFRWVIREWDMLAGVTIRRWGDSKPVRVGRYE